MTTCELDNPRWPWWAIIILGLIFAALLFGCCNQKPIVIDRTVHDTTTVTTTITERDTAFIVVADSAKVVFDCDSLLRAAYAGKKPQIQSRGQRSSVNIAVNDQGRIEATANCDEWEKKFKILDTVTKIAHSRQEVKNTPIYIDRPLKWHQELLYTAGQWAIGILFLWAIIAILMRLLRSRLNRE